MLYRIEFKPAALRDLKKLDRDVQERVKAKIESLAHNPRPPGAETLKGGEGLLRVRVGDFRIVYAMRDKILLVLVVKIGHRREVYRDL